MPGSPPDHRAPTSIQSRIAAAATGAAMVVLCAACAVFVQVQAQDGRAAFQSRQDAISRLMARDVAVRLAEGRDPAAALRLVEAAAPGSEARLLDRHGRVVARLGRAPPRSQTSHAAVGGASVGEVVLAGSPPPFALVAPRYLAVCGALLFAATGLALMVGRILARRVVQPVERLALVMAGVQGSEQFGVRAPRGAPDEVGRLTDRFNELLARLQANDGALRLSLSELTRARDAAEAANRMKSQFLANMSHEIRTPLNGVLAMTQVIAMGELTDEQRGRLAVVHDSGQALLAILNDVLDVSKIEAGRLELELAEIDAAAVVRGACEAFGAVVADKGLRLEVDIAAEACGPRIGDGVRLRQIVVNLVSNAVKFTPSGGVAVRVRGSGANGREGLVIEVADTGVGIAGGLIPGLFDKFTQGDSSITRKFGGTGLGLAICAELAGLMGGGIEVESAEGRGALFRLRIPLAAGVAPSAAPVVPDPPERPAVYRSAGERPLQAGLTDAHPTSSPTGFDPAQTRILKVLAAEDNPTNRLVLSTVMGVFGVDLKMVEDGAQAVTAWEAERFDVILMDIQMPVMDGVAAARAIRAAEAARGLPRTPILALSANAMTHQVSDYMAAGMDAHVPKPIELPRLHAAIVHAVEVVDRATGRAA